MANTPTSRTDAHPSLKPLLLLVVLIACIAPIWTVSLPPATDLPQHLSQIFLLEEVLHGNQPSLKITAWYFPNTLVYGLLWVFWQIADPVTAGRLMVSALAGLWVSSSYLLCKLRQRPIENWLIGTPLVFNFIFYWGLLNFLIGWPIFCVFIAIASDTSRKRKGLLLAGIALALYFAHALWFLMANFWLLIHMIDRTGKPSIRTLATMTPAWALALIWYPQLASNRQASGADTGLTWGPMPIEKLDPSYLTNSALGGLHSQIEPIYLVVITLWILASLITNKAYLKTEIDQPILIGALMLILAFWALPATYMNTIFFNQRWLPNGLILLLLALPSPKIRQRSMLVMLGLWWLLAFSITSIAAWSYWEKEELDGLASSVSQIEKGERVFGLDMQGESLFIKGRPGLQIFSYAQVLNGAELNFSFVEHYSGIVQYREKHAANPSRKLIWAPLQVTKEDLSTFDKALIGGDENLHEFARNRFGLEQLVPSNHTWRLYRIKPP